MADQYIEESNQELLWNIFNKVPDINKIAHEQRRVIFHESLAEIYDNISPHIPVLTKEDLQILNKKTITNFLKKIKEVTKIMYQNPYVQEIVPPQESYYETPKEQTANHFQEKQKEYELMTEKPNVPKPSELFKEPSDSIEDNKIQNMDELIAKYQQQRDLDVPNINPIQESESKEIIEPKEEIIEPNKKEQTMYKSNDEPIEIQMMREIQQALLTLEQSVSDLNTIYSKVEERVSNLENNIAKII